MKWWRGLDQRCFNQCCWGFIPRSKLREERASRLPSRQIIEFSKYSLVFLDSAVPNRAYYSRSTDIFLEFIIFHKKLPPLAVPPFSLLSSIQLQMQYTPYKLWSMLPWQAGCFGGIYRFRLVLVVGCCLFANKLMNTEGNLSLNRAEDSEVIQLNDPQGDDEQSFGDLGEDNAVMEEEPGQRIVIDEDTMESNDFLLGSIDPSATKQPPSPIAPQETPPSPSLPPPSKPSSSDSSFYKGLVRKLEESSYNDQTLQPSYLDFQAAERRYLEQVKILYCHFLIGDKALNKGQFQQLRALLFVPNYGQSLVKWANKKYGHTLTLPLALERLDLMEKATLEPKRRCYDEVRLLVMLAVLLIIIKLLS